MLLINPNPQALWSAGVAQGRDVPLLLSLPALCKARLLAARGRSAESGHHSLLQLSCGQGDWFFSPSSIPSWATQDLHVKSKNWWGGFCPWKKILGEKACLPCDSVPCEIISKSIKNYQPLFSLLCQRWSQPLTSMQHLTAHLQKKNLLKSS